MVDWEPLVGIIPPLNESQWLQSFERYQQFPEFRQRRPDMTLTEYKHIFFWEYLHRVLARVIGLVFLVPYAFLHITGAITAPFARRALALFGLGAMQGLIGWLMVRSGLVDLPSVSHYRLAIHLVVAMAIFAFCIWLIRDLSDGPEPVSDSTSARRRTSTILLAIGCLIGLQIVWGAFVAGLRAGFMFNTFPLMDGALVPIRYWILTPTVLNLFEHPSGVQWMHRLLGTLLLVAVFVFCVYARRTSMDRTSRILSAALLSAVTAQYLLGVLTLVRLVPLELAVAHQAMAMVIVGVWAAAMHHARRRHIA